MENYKEETIASYNKDAEKHSKRYKDVMDLTQRKEFGEFLNLLQGKKILDLGCGSGDHSAYFVEKGLDVTAIDLSDKMIKLCKEKGINAIKMDIEDLEFGENSFDGIWAVTSLIHVPKSRTPKVVKKIHEILKKNGILYICLEKGQGEEMVGENNKRFFAFWKKQEFLDLLEENFQLIQFKEVLFRGRIFLTFFLRKR